VGIAPVVSGSLDSRTRKGHRANRPVSIIELSTMQPTDIAWAIADVGCCVTGPRLTPDECRRLQSSPMFGDRTLPCGGGRNLLDVAEYCDLARSPAVRGVAEAVLGPDCFAVRGLAFDKRPDANWWVPWHQDLNVAVKVRNETPGFGPWSVKAGVPHAQAPVEVLEAMLAVRVHLDNCGPESGPLHVLPRSHLSGILGTAEILVRAAITAAAGAILAFRPLLLHSSHPAAAPSHRRVIHFEFAAHDLPGPEWYWRQ
jgi:hypothetical protein